MQTDILTALLAFFGTCIGTLGGILASNKLTNYRIGQLEKKVEKHNNVLERVYKLEKADAVEEEEIKVINHRIADLEKYHQKA